jgi:hypothetical protein
MRLALVVITVAVIAAIESNPLAAADSQNGGLQNSQKVPKRKVVTRPYHGFVVQEHYWQPPLACRAVAFPRSPLCAGQPYWDSYYGFPFNWTSTW